MLCFKSNYLLNKQTGTFSLVGIVDFNLVQLALLDIGIAGCDNGVVAGVIVVEIELG